MKIHPNKLKPVIGRKISFPRMGEVYLIVGERDECCNIKNVWILRQLEGPPSKYGVDNFFTPKDTFNKDMKTKNGIVL